MNACVARKKTKQGDRFYVVVEVGRTPEGKPIKKWEPRGYRTRTEAKKVAGQINHRIAEGLYVASQKVRLDEYLRSWIESNSDLRPGTAATYMTIAEAHIIRPIGHRLLQDLKPIDLDQLYADLRKTGGRYGQGLNPKTVRNAHVLLKKSLKDAVWKGLLTVNPADRVRPPAPRYKSPKSATWSPEQVKLFLDEARADRLAAAWMLAATTGMRRGEVLGLKWEDIDLGTGWLSVRQTVVVVDGQATLSTPKTDAGSRSIHLTPQAVAALRAHRTRQLEERLALGLPKVEMVFTDINGHYINPNAFTRRFVTLSKAAGLPVIRLHDLRHSVATILLQRRVPVRIVSEVLGHANTAITDDIYSHVIPSMKEEVSGALGAAVFGGTGQE